MKLGGAFFASFPLAIQTMFTFFQFFQAVRINRAIIFRITSPFKSRLGIVEYQGQNTYVGLVFERINKQERLEICIQHIQLSPGIQP